MSTTTIDRPAVTIDTTTEAAPLSTSELNSLITMAAATEKIARVKGGDLPGTSRGFSLGGNID